MPPIDKQAHFWWGWAIAATLCPVSIWLGIFAAVVVGALKEVWDTQGHGTPEVKDFLATTYGGATGAFFYLLLTSL